jgi:hypothetical protein
MDMKIYRRVSPKGARSTICYTVRGTRGPRQFLISEVATVRSEDGSWRPPEILRHDDADQGTVFPHWARRHNVALLNPVGAKKDDLSWHRDATLLLELDEMRVELGRTDPGHVPFADFVWASKHRPRPEIMALSEMDLTPPLSDQELREVMYHVVPPCFKHEADHDRHERLYRHWASGYDDPSREASARNDLLRESQNNFDLSEGRASELVATIAGAVFRRSYALSVVGMRSDWSQVGQLVSVRVGKATIKVRRHMWRTGASSEASVDLGPDSGPNRYRWITSVATSSGTAFVPNAKKWSEPSVETFMGVGPGPALVPAWPEVALVLDAVVEQERLSLAAAIAGRTPPSFGHRSWVEGRPTKARQYRDFELGVDGLIDGDTEAIGRKAIPPNYISENAKILDRQLALEASWERGYADPSRAEELRAWIREKASVDGGRARVTDEVEHKIVELAGAVYRQGIESWMSSL